MWLYSFVDYFLQSINSNSITTHFRCIVLLKNLCVECVCISFQALPFNTRTMLPLCLHVFYINHHLGTTLSFVPISCMYSQEITYLTQFYMVSKLISWSQCLQPTSGVYINKLAGYSSYKLLYTFYYRKSMITD